AEASNQSAPAYTAPPATQPELRQITIKTDRWKANLSNKGAVITGWIMTNFPDGKSIDPPKGVNLVSEELSKRLGAPLRFHIPSNLSLEKELNTAVYKVETPSDRELTI